MKIILKFLMLLTMSLPAFAQREGGNTSGGGDLFGINEYSVAIKATIKAIQESGDKVYDRKQMKKLNDLFKMKIYVGSSDADHFERDHAVQVDGVTQVGSAHSTFAWGPSVQHAEMVINKDEWIKAKDRIGQMALINHEFLVMLGIEATAYYEHTNRFLVYLRKIVERETSYRSVVFRFSLYSLEVDSEGNSSLGKLIDSSEQKAETEAMSFRFNEVFGCYQKSGYLTLGAGVSALSRNQLELGSHCENLQTFLSEGVGSNLPYQVVYDPSGSTGFESKSFEIGKKVLVIQVIRFGSIFNYGK